MDSFLDNFAAAGVFATQWPDKSNSCKYNFDMKSSINRNGFTLPCSSPYVKPRIFSKLVFDPKIAMPYKCGCLPGSWFRGIHQRGSCCI